MVESEKYCINILHQFKAVRNALRSLEIKILERHVEKCVTDAVNTKSKKAIKKKLDEIVDLLHKSSK